MADGARHHRTRQVGREAGARDHRQLGAEDPAVVVEAHFVLVVEAVAPAGDHEVVVAVEAQLHRPAELVRGDRGDAGEQARLRLLAAEAAAHAPAFHLDVMRVQAEAMRHQVLHLARMLGRAVHEHAAVFARHGIRDLAFEIELLLAADLERVLQPMRCGVDGGARVAARQVHRRQHVALGRVRFDRREQGRQGLDAQGRLRAGRGEAGRVARFGDDGEDRLADVVHDAVGEDRVVVDDRAAVVDAGDVVRGEHGHHAGHRLDARQVDGGDAAVRHRRQAERRMQRAGELGQVVDVGRAAGHVQVRRLVRARDADAGARLQRLVFVGRVRPQPGRVEGAIHGSDAAFARRGATCTIECQTLVSCAASGASRRVSSQKRRSRFFAACRR